MSASVRDNLSSRAVGHTGAIEEGEQIQEREEEHEFPVKLFDYGCLLVLRVVLAQGVCPSRSCKPPLIFVVFAMGLVARRVVLGECTKTIFLASY